MASSTRHLLETAHHHSARAAGLLSGMLERGVMSRRMLAEVTYHIRTAAAHTAKLDVAAEPAKPRNRRRYG